MPQLFSLGSALWKTQTYPMLWRKERDKARAQSSSRGCSSPQPYPKLGITAVNIMKP